MAVEVWPMSSSLSLSGASTRLSSVAKVAEIVRKYKVERVCMFDPNAAKELESVLGMKVLKNNQVLEERDIRAFNF